jgi:hypothetical protein
VSKQPFRLTDDQAARLLIALRPIDERHPVDTRSNRPFLRDFIRAVHSVTGRMFSPTIYRRLLGAYAPCRRPSTTTLALEKEFVEAEIAAFGRPQLSGSEPIPVTTSSREYTTSSSANMSALIRRTVDDAFAREARTRTGADAEHWHVEQRMAQAHIADLGTRLTVAERALSEARADAARLAADLQLAQERAATYQQQLMTAEQTARTQGQAHLDALRDLAGQMEEIRKFAMRSIDDIRGETRAERDRRVHVEGLLRQNQKMLEVFRQMAYQRGSSIPHELKIETK